MTPEQQEEYRRQHINADGKFCLNPRRQKGDKVVWLCDNRQKWSEMSRVDKFLKCIGGWFGAIILFGLALEFIARVIL